MNQTNRAQKSNRRRRGRGELNYILINGIFYVGLPLTLMQFVLRSGCNYFFDFSALQKSNDNLLVEVFINLMVWSIFGCAVRVFEWQRKEKEFSGGE
jgi:hypothetical protein